MGGGERGKKAWAVRCEEKIRTLNLEKYQLWILSIWMFFRGEDYGNVVWSVGKNNAKSMTVANGGNAIEDRRSVVFVRLGAG